MKAHSMPLGTDRASGIRLATTQMCWQLALCMPTWCLLDSIHVDAKILTACQRAALLGGLLHAMGGSSPAWS